MSQRAGLPGFHNQLTVILLHFWKTGNILHAKSMDFWWGTIETTITTTMIISCGIIIPSRVFFIEFLIDDNWWVTRVCLVNNGKLRNYWSRSPAGKPNTEPGNHTALSTASKWLWHCQRPFILDTKTFKKGAPAAQASPVLPNQIPRAAQIDDASVGGCVCTVDSKVMMADHLQHVSTGSRIVWTNQNRPPRLGPTVSN